MKELLSSPKIMSAILKAAEAAETVLTAAETATVITDNKRRRRSRRNIRKPLSCITAMKILLRKLKTNRKQNRKRKENLPGGKNLSKDSKAF